MPVEVCLLRKQIAGALVASLLLGSAPAWADDGTAKTVPEVTVVEQAQRQELRQSFDRAIDQIMQGAPASRTAGIVLDVAAPWLTAQERRDLERRRAALRTDPVARGAGSIVMLLVGAALSIGLTVYLVKKAKDSSNTMPSLGPR
jgi:hypothetical protein